MRAYASSGDRTIGIVGGDIAIHICDSYCLNDVIANYSWNVCEIDALRKRACARRSAVEITIWR